MVKKGAVYPRAVVKVNGRSIEWDSWRVEQNTNSEADTFHVTIAKNKAPNLMSGDVDVEIYFGVFDDARSADNASEGSMTKMISGSADVINWYYRDNKVTIEGRDKTARMIDRKNTKKWKDKKTEQIAQEIASEAGLGFEAQTSGHLCGTISCGECILLQENMTDWDLLCEQVRKEGNECFVRGDKLIYRKPLQFGERGQVRFVWGEDLTDLHVHREIQNSKGVKVLVRGYNQQMNRTNSASMTASGGGRGGAPSAGGSRTKEYIIEIPNVTQQDAIQFAKGIANKVNVHELGITVYTLADPSYNVDMVVFIEAQESELQQAFYPKSIITTFDLEQGATVEIECINHHGG